MCLPLLISLVVCLLTPLMTFSGELGNDTSNNWWNKVSAFMITTGIQFFFFFFFWGGGGCLFVCLFFFCFFVCFCVVVFSGGGVLFCLSVSLQHCWRNMLTDIDVIFGRGRKWYQKLVKLRQCSRSHLDPRFFNFFWAAIARFFHTPPSAILFLGHGVLYI